MNTGDHCIRKYVILIWRRVCELIITLNIFENVDKPNPSEEQLRTERKWTRAYFVALTLILGNILFFTSLIYQMKTIRLNNPTLDLYKTLPHSTICPCTTLSIPYYTFIDLSPSFHQVCSSIFVEEGNGWMSILKHFYFTQIEQNRNIRTFQSTALLHFQALRIMCDTANETVQSELSLFLNSTFVSVRMIEFDLFEKQINVTLSNLFFNRISSNFVHSLQAIRAMYSGNSLVSVFGTSWYPEIRNETSDGMIYMKPQEYNLSSCNCATSSACMEPMILKLNSGSTWIIPGMMIACLPIESMLQSTLECLYDQDCLNMISKIISTDSFPPLFANRTRFHPINTTRLDSIVAELFLEEWHTNVSYEAYFNACQPNTCSYTLSKYFHILYGLSMFLTIYGGLDIVLKIIIPITFKLARKCLLWRKSRQATINIS